MGTVCKAYDRATGEVVGLKVLRTRPGADVQRFRREAQLLSKLSHPAIVRHLTHGTSPKGSFYLVMEWLDGEDLATRLAREGLSVRDSIALVRRAAAALTVAHNQGIIHRDIKPGNLFLVDGEPRQVKVLDFGIARPTLATRGVTRTGAMVGTLGYIAPEQACGERELDSRVDVFSLGCVLFECLTGEAAFKGARAVAVLAKILFGETPHVREIRQDLPSRVDEAVAGLMAKDREARPRDAAVVVEILDRLDPLASVPAPGPSVHRVLTTDEQRFLSVILISSRDDDDIDEATTLEPEESVDPLSAIRTSVEPLGGQLTALANGAVLVTLKGIGTAKDLAARAAACALSVRSAAPDAQVCLATGPLEVLGEWPAGRVFDRVAAVQETNDAQELRGVCIDDVTAALLDTRFEINGSGPIRELVGDRPSLGARRLLGKETPCVGREKELAFLEAAFEDCIHDPSATAVLVTGPAGGGKTRLAHEFVERLRARDEQVMLIFARGDPVSAGSAFSLASQLVRHAVRLRQGDDPTVQHAMLRSALGQIFEGEELIFVAELLGELVQAPTPDEPSPRLLAARNDPRVKNEQLKRAFIDGLGAICRDTPILIVLDNLQWGDPPSVTFLHAALRWHSETPLMVLGLARPEVVDVFPGLWLDVGLHRLGLGALKRRAATQLVRSVLSESIDEEIIDRTVEQAGGNAFFLEELIRHVAEKGTVDFPDSVLAMAQSRLEALDPEARRILRGGSVFGRVFWDGAVASLLGSEMSAEDLPLWLDALVKGEILMPSQESKFSGHKEFSFRHELLREAAYAMLTENDCTLGHHLAGEWLENAGELESLVIAEHFERGGQNERAIPYLVRAAQAAFDGGHLEAILSIAERGLSYGATGEDRGRFLLFLSGQAVWTADFENLSKTTREALELLPYGSSGWFMALAGLAFAGSFGGDNEALLQVIETLRNFGDDLPPIAPVGYAAHALNASLVFMGQADEARALSRRLEEAIDRSTTPDPVFLAYRHVVRGWLSLSGLLPVGRAIPQIKKSLDHLEIAHSPLSKTAALYALAVAQWVTGDFEQCLATSRAAITRSEDRGVELLERWSRWTMGNALVFLGRLEEGMTTLSGLVESSDKVLAVSAHLSIATALLVAGRNDDALLHIEAIRPVAKAIPIRHTEVLAVLAELNLRNAHPRQALELARECLECVPKTGVQPLFESMARLTMIEALETCGETAEARVALEEAKACILEQAATFEDDASRDIFLENIPPNAQILKLACERLTLS